MNEASSPNADVDAIRLGVLFVIKNMGIGGGQFVFRTIVEHLDRRRFRPAIACLGEAGTLGDELRRHGVTVHADLLRHKADAAVLLRLRRIIRRESIAVLYLMDYRDVMLWGALAGRLAGVPTILATHSTDWWGRDFSPTLIGQRLLPWHSRVVAVAEFQRRHLVAAEDVSASRIVVVPNGVDVERYAAVSPTVDPSNRRPIIVGTVAVLRPEKNLGMLLDAVRRLGTGGHDVRLVIVGDGPERASLERLAASLRIGDRVTFLGYRDPAPLLPGFDVFAQCSRIEVMPVTILDAMAAGVPVVATAVGGIPDIVVEGETGFLVASDDVAGLAERLARLTASPELRRRMGRRGRERVRDCFRLEPMIAAIDALLVETASPASRLSRG